MEFFLMSFNHPFLNGIAEHGPGYELPSSLTLKSRLIPDIKKEVEEYVENVIKDSVNKPGCTLMYNLWTSRTLVIKHMDIFAYAPIGVACMYPPDRISGDIYFFEQTMSSIMELIGPTNIVQFIIITTLMMMVVMRSVQHRLCFLESILGFTRLRVLGVGLDCS